MTEYHLIRCSSTELTVLRALTQDELAAYRNAVHHLREFDKSPAYLELVARNHLEVETEAAVWSQSAAALAKDPALREHREIEFNRRVINYLSAVRLLLDHYEARLKRRYGATSAQVLAFKTECAASYDGHFSYRFLYRLRNFAQHFGMPVSHVHAGSRLEGPTSSTIIYDATILLDVGDLLALGGDLWGKVRDELKTMGPLLDIQPHLTAVTRELNRIVSLTQAAERPRLVDAAKVIETIVSDAIANGATPGVALVERHPPKSTFQFLQPPFRLMQWLGMKGFDHPL